MIAAGVGSFGVHRAQAGLAIKVEAVAIGHAGQGEDPGLLIEVPNDAGFAQALCDLLRGLIALEASTTSRRIRSSMRTSTGKVQQVAWQSPHRPLL